MFWRKQNGLLKQIEKIASLFRRGNNNLWLQKMDLCNCIKNLLKQVSHKGKIQKINKIPLSISDKCKKTVIVQYKYPSILKGTLY